MKSTLVGTCLALLLLMTTSATPLQQTAAKGSIEGVITRAGTGEPIPGARISLTRTGAAVASVAASPGTLLPPAVTISSLNNGPTSMPTAVADGEGRFVFKDLDSGSYRVYARANGYSKQEYGQQTPGGQGRPVSLNSGQAIRDVGIPLTPAGNVTGRVRDNSGQPVVGVQVQILMATYNANGQRSFQSGGLARTDDRGEYRLFWITPGRYYVMAANGTSAINGTTVGSPNETNGDAIAPTYYPGTTDVAQASVIDVKPGSDTGGVDIFVTRQGNYRIRGRVIDGRSGQVLQGGVTITLITTTPTGSYSTTNVNPSYNAQDGSFELRDVSPGPHVVRAQTMPGATTVTPGTAGVISTAASGTVPLNVTSDMDGIVITISSVVSISGHLSMEGSSPSGSTGLNQVRVQLRPSVDGVLTPALGGPTPLSQPTTPDGAFRIDTVLPGEYRLSVSPLPMDLYVKQARFGQADILNKPMQFAASDSGILDVLLSPRGGQIEGTVSDDKQHPVQGIQAVLIPDQTRDRIDLYKTATTDANGRFTIRGIAPGDYRVFAWEVLDPFAYFDPDLLRQYEQKGKPVHISESSKEPIDVRMIPAEP